MSVTGGYAQRFTRDADGLVTSIGPVSGTSVPSLSMVRSPLDGHVTSTTAGVVGTTVELDVSASAPGFGDLRSLGATRTTDGSVLYDADYEVDDAGRIVRWTETVEGVTSDRRFDYDAASRLVGVRDGATNAPLATYAFDGNGNRARVLDVRAGAGAQDVELGRNLGCDDPSTGTPLARAANAQDQLCRYGDFTFAYDANGRLQTRTNTATGQTLSLRYDAAGRLRQATSESGQTVHYVNDALGRRVGRVVNGALERGLIYGSELAPIAEVNAAGQVTQTYVYASRPNVPDLIVQADGDVYRVIHDHLGSVRLVVNVATGAVAHRMRFDEWGVLVEESGDATLHPFGYAGGLYDRTTGLTRFGARDYDPATGRWTAKDPIGFAAEDSNLYAYSGNSPANFCDPSGKILFIPILAAMAGGALMGALFDVGFQLATNGFRLECIDLKSVAVSALVGGIAGGFGRAIYLTTSVAIPAFVRGATSAAVGLDLGVLGRLVKDEVTDHPSSGSQYAMAGLSGMSGGAFGGTTGGAINVARRGLADAVQAPRMGR